MVYDARAVDCSDVVAVRVEAVCPMHLRVHGRFRGDCCKVSEKRGGCGVVSLLAVVFIPRVSCDTPSGWWW